MGFPATLFQLGQPTACLLQRGPGQAGQRGHLQAEAPVRRPLLHRMHEDQRIAVLHSVQMHVGDAAAGFSCERRQLEIMGGEQRVAAVGAGQVARHRVRQRQAVVSRGAAADLVHQHQRL